MHSNHRAIARTAWSIIIVSNWRTRHRVTELPHLPHILSIR